MRRLPGTGTLTASQTFNWFVTAGVVTLTNPGAQTNNEGDTVSLQLSATDSNNSPLTYQAIGSSRPVLAKPTGVGHCQR
jgi:hypothetical protein